MPTFGSVDTQTDLTGGGTLIINAARPPTDTDGVVGDYWLDTAGKTLYGPKGVGGYGATETAHIATGPAYTIGDFGTYSLGVRFKVLVAGRITGMRYYRDIANGSGNHTLSLYSAAGALLASASTTGETVGSGWRTALLATPLAVAVNADLVASELVYGTNSTIYSVGTPTSVIPSHITFTETRSLAGGGFPTVVSGNDYYVDVLFQPTLVAWPIAIKSAP